VDLIRQVCPDTFPDEIRVGHVRFSNREALAAAASVVPDALLKRLWLEDRISAEACLF